MDYTTHKQIEFRRKFFKIMGAEIYMSDPTTQQELGVIKMKAWKLKEDIRLFTDRTMQQELIRIGARSVIDFGATYDVFDSPTNQQLFSLRRKGLRSTFVRDHWDMKDVNGVDIGYVQETSSGLALIRRWIELVPFGDILGLIFAFVPQTYTINLNGNEIATITHRKNPVIVKMDLAYSDSQAKTDPRIGVAVVALLSVVDASKNA